MPAMLHPQEHICPSHLKLVLLDNGDWSSRSRAYQSLRFFRTYGNVLMWVFASFGGKRGPFCEFYRCGDDALSPLLVARVRKAGWRTKRGDVRRL